MFTVIGLVLVILAWGVQLLQVAKGKHQIMPAFVGLYVLGVALLVGDGLMAGMTQIAYLNLISLAVALATFFLLVKRG